MRKLPLLLVLLLIAPFAAAGPARALSVPAPPLPAGEEAEESEAEVEGEEAELEEGEACEVGPEEGETCEEAEETAEAEECVIEDAAATVAANPGNDTVRVTIRYRALEPTAVAIDARLHGSKGGLHVGADRTRFRRAGVFHDSFGLSKKEMVRALAAREFAIELHAVNTPPSCRMQLTAHRGGGPKLLWS